MDNRSTHRRKDLIQVLKRTLLTISCLILISTSYGCNTTSDTFGSTHGSVIKVEERNEEEIQLFVIEDGKSKTWVFHTTGIIDFNTPDHLEWHMTNNQAIKVFYERTADKLIAISIFDYP